MHVENTTSPEPARRFPARAPRRWLRYGLRSLLLATTVIACLVGWKVRQVRTQQRAVAVLRSENRTYYYNFDNRVPGQDRAPWYVPRTIHDWLGPDVFQRVRTVGGYADPPLSEAAMDAILTLPKLDFLEGRFDGPLPANWPSIGTLRQLRALDLRAPRMTDEDLAPLLSLDRLENLALRSTRMTDAGAARLVDLTTLRFVLIENGALTDAGAAHLLTLPNVTLLSLLSVQMSDETLVRCSRKRQLSSLVVTSPAITDAGVEHLMQLPLLDSLGLSSPKITDAGLQAIGEIKSLSVLFLPDTAITDAGLRQLDSLQQLEFLDVANTAVTDAGIKQFIQQHPGCKVAK